MKFEYIGAFRAGAPVPEWLLTADPLTPGPPVRFIFGSDSHVIRTGGGIYIIADVPCLEQVLIQIDGRYVYLTATATEEGEKPSEHAEGTPRFKAVAPSGTVAVPFRFAMWDKGRDDGEGEPSEPDPPRTRERA